MATKTNNENQLSIDFTTKNDDELRYAEEMMLELDSISMKDLEALDDRPEVSKKTFMDGDYGRKSYVITEAHYNPCTLHVAA